MLTYCHGSGNQSEEPTDGDKPDDTEDNPQSTYRTQIILNGRTGY
jgi:hypothetical protein